MRKSCFATVGLILAVFVLLGCSRAKHSRKASANSVDTALTAPTIQPAAVVYYCPMDTEVVSDKPDKCSKCGMDLIEKRPETK